MWERLWRRTVTLAHEYPTLWLPVVIADLADFALRHAKSVVKPQLLLAVLRTHSVLGAESLSMSTGRRVAVMFTGGGVELAVYFATIAFYVTAFFTTACIVRQRLGSGRVSQRNFWKELLALSLRGLLVIVVIAIASGLAWALSALGKGYPFKIPWLVIDLWSLLAMSLLACVMVPAGLRALARPEITHIDRAVVRLGRKCALAAVVASTSLMIIVQILGRWFAYKGYAAPLVIQAIDSLVVALPYAPLYVALALLAEGEQGEAIEAEAGSAPADP